MVHVSVGDDNLLDLQLMFSHQRQHVLNIIARINDDRLTRSLVADHRAIALQRPHRQDLMNHHSILVDQARPSGRPAKRKSSAREDSDLEKIRMNPYLAGAGCEVGEDG